MIGTILDNKIAVEVMGWKMEPAPFGPTKSYYQCWHQDGKTVIPVHLFNPSEDMNMAWLVVEHLQQRKGDFNLKFSFNKWEATFKTGAYYEPVDHCSSEIAAEAICKAALDYIKTI